MGFLLLASFMTYTKNCPKSAGNNMCSVLVWGNGNNTCRNSKTRRDACMWFQHACFTVPRAVKVLLLAPFMTYKQQELSQICGKQYVLFTCARQREQRFQKFKNATWDVWFQHVSPFLGRWEFCFWHHSWRANNKNCHSLGHHPCSLLARGNKQWFKNIIEAPKERPACSWEYSETGHMTANHTHWVEVKS